jgi:polyhydroxybutyrate depolymerase
MVTALLALLLLVGCGWTDFAAEELPETSACRTWPTPGSYRVTVPGHSRRPWVFVPADLGRRDAIIVLHGAAGTSQRIRSTTVFRQEAGRRGMPSIFPDGTGDAERYYGYTWNAGGCCGVARSQQSDDLRFLEDLAVVVRRRLCLDNLLVAGHSNGGMMAERWTCEGTGVDAIFSVSGPLVVPECTGSPKPVLAWHGTQDPIVPFHGGPFRLGGDLPDAREAFDRVKRRNGCTAQPPNIATEEDLTCETWTCTVPTTFCTLDGWGHEWPGGAADRMAGPNAEQVALDWFDGRVTGWRGVTP